MNTSEVKKYSKGLVNSIKSGKITLEEAVIESSIKTGCTKDYARKILNDYLKSGYSNNPDYVGDWFGKGQIDFNAIINPEDDGDIWMVKMWSGAGYILDVYLCKATNLYDAIDTVFEWSWENEGENNMVFDLDYVYKEADEYFESDPYMFSVTNRDEPDKEDFEDRFIEEYYVGDSNYGLFARSENFFVDKVPEEVLAENQKPVQNSRRPIKSGTSIKEYAGFKIDDSVKINSPKRGPYKNGKTGIVVGFYKRYDGEILISVQLDEGGLMDFSKDELENLGDSGYHITYLDSSRKSIKSGYEGDDELKAKALQKVKEYGGKRINSKPIEILEILDDGEYSAFLIFTFKSGNDTYEMVYDYGFGGKSDKPSIKKIESSHKSNERRAIKSMAAVSKNNRMDFKSLQNMAGMYLDREGIKFEESNNGLHVDQFGDIVINSETDSKTNRSQGRYSIELIPNAGDNDSYALFENAENDYYEGSSINEFQEDMEDILREIFAVGRDNMRSIALSFGEDYDTDDLDTCYQFMLDAYPEFKVFVED